MLVVKNLSRKLQPISNNGLQAIQLKHIQLIQSLKCLKLRVTSPVEFNTLIFFLYNKKNLMEVFLYSWGPSAGNHVPQVSSWGPSAGDHRIDYHEGYGGGEEREGECVSFHGNSFACFRGSRDCGERMRESDLLWCGIYRGIWFWRSANLLSGGPTWKNNFGK
jgi:hypothetical protein